MTLLAAWTSGVRRKSGFTQRSNYVRRADYAICFSGLLAAGAIAVRILELPTHSWSALCVAGATIAFAWLFWTIFPLAYLAYLHLG